LDLGVTVLTLRSRFLSKCGTATANGCIPWLANKLPKGYGILRLKRDGKWTQGYAHRIAWELAKGEIPDGAHVLHRCDNPSCVNHKHLFLGNQKTNMQDMAVKGRHHMRIGGLLAGLNEVDDERILDLKRSGCTHDAIAAWLNISGATVSFVLRGKLAHSASNLEIG
jgi:HNH endonuclease